MIIEKVKKNTYQISLGSCSPKYKSMSRNSSEKRIHILHTLNRRVTLDQKLPGKQNKLIILPAIAPHANLRIQSPERTPR